MKYFYFLTFITFLFGCVNMTKVKPPRTSVFHPEILSIQEKITNLKDPKNKKIIVAAHRGDWRNAPENSLKAYQNCIDMNVDIIEIDVRVTKDNQLVIMHDETLDRTTTGTGYVKDWTLDSLNTLRLKDGLGVPTSHHIPTLKEVLNLAKNKILVFLDKSEFCFDKCVKVVEETGTQDQVIFKPNEMGFNIKKEFWKYSDTFHIMPKVNLNDPYAMDLIEKYLVEGNPIAIEFVFEKDPAKPISVYVNKIKGKDKGASIWINSLWPQLCGGHNDEKAIENVNIYQWYIDNDIDIIQTDRPKLLLDYLKNKGLHN